MKAVGYTRSLPISDPASLEDLELPEPTPEPRDLRVKVHAISVNPVDAKIRMRMAGENGQPRILGWDVAGVVEAAGERTSRFKPGDEVFYAGSLTRPGANSEYHVVDERLVGRKPKTLSFAEAAAMPLTSLTAWELLFDRLGVAEDAAETLLIVGGAGGVGSMLIQIARQLTRLTVVATASRKATHDWCRTLGAHTVVDHTKLAEDLAAVGAPDYVAALTGSDKHFPTLAECLAPQGRIAIIDDPEALDATLLKRKSASLHWEFMFTRPMFETADMARQGEILDRVADLVDAGKLRTTMRELLGLIDAKTLRNAHERLESGQTIGKLVLEGF
ncbi:Zinc-binding alcohol dehydrogenase family protein [uncultured Alphaproteobacteria bacterium]|uniref:Zinc-type alcohol dehydrogenase-like protein n=1 Tax=uncultured Alphaproteobacteria bacterium TaxID=91750 RepID=A0A212KLX8_9PROT|nr:Zinc-binding alcohol dehydrogenase family protein [uncultured Alphaproteobacteria bacterium]